MISDPDYYRPEYTERDLAADQLADHGHTCDCEDCETARTTLEGT